MKTNAQVKEIGKDKDRVGPTINVYRLTIHNVKVRTAAAWGAIEILSNSDKTLPGRLLVFETFPGDVFC